MRDGKGMEHSPQILRTFPPLLFGNTLCKDLYIASFILILGQVVVMHSSVSLLCILLHLFPWFSFMIKSSNIPARAQTRKGH